jgi:hypothetical protein
MLALSPDPHRARSRYRARFVPSSSSPSVTNRRRGSRASYGPKGQDSLAPGLPWVSEKSVLSPEGAVDVMWRVNAGDPGSDGPSPYHLPSSLFHRQSRARTTTRTRRAWTRTSTSTRTIAVSIANSHPKTSRPFRANRPNGSLPRLKPWASLFNRARARYRPVPSSPSVTNRRRGSRASYGPKGQDSLAPGLPWVSHKSVLSPEGAVDVMWRVNAGDPGSDGPSPYRLPSSLFHPQSRARTIAVSVAGPKNKSTTNKTKNYEPFTRNPNLCRRGYPQK